MANNIEFQNLKRQYPEFFKEFPPKLMEVIFSDETASKISSICLKNNIKDGKIIEGVAFHIISVLLDRLPQEILSKALMTNLKIDVLTAKRISEEANRLIFSQLTLPKTEKSTEMPAPTAPLPEEKPIIEAIKEPIKEELPKPQGKDVYHEPIA